MHEAAAGEAVAASAPEDGAAEIAGDPAEESEQVTERVEESGAQQLAFMDGAGGHEGSEDHSLEKAVSEQRKSERGSPHGQSGGTGQDAEGQAEGKDGAEVSERTGEAGGLHPSGLVAEGIEEADVEDDVIDDVMGEYDCFTLGGDVGAQEEVVRAIGTENTESAHGADGTAADGHGGAEGELHSFEEIGGEDAGGHFDGHAGGFELRPQTARGYAAVEAGDGSHFGIGKRSGDLTDIAGSHADVAVANDEDVMAGGGFHQFQG